MKVSNSPDLSNEPKVVTLKETINELGSVINTENIHNPKKLLKLSKKIDRLYFSIENPNQRKIARNESLKLLSHIDIGTLQDASLAIDSSEYTSQISIVALVISILSIVRSVYPQNWFLLILIFPIVYILGILLVDCKFNPNFWTNCSA
ncbi:hypothetical protein [Lactiplantibacillus fabifermentans]|uniref:hypothetical protein n=1 Tax=Lactiplantibacillus fabifermentans TaxID=483011 RepID=UPI000704BA99|nr:hypothetical protein [Lactiplantibacillus fabifermentans]